MANNIHIIGGRNVVVEPDCENVVLVNCSDMTVTADSDGTTNFNNGALIINSNETVSINEALVIETHVTSFSASLGVHVYMLDATISAITVTVDPAIRQKFIFKRVDGSSNAVAITPSSGLIDGAGSYALAAQWQTVTIISDGPDFYII